MDNFVFHDPSGRRAKQANFGVGLVIAAAARAHRWYMSAREITIYDIYVFESEDGIDPAMFTDIIGRHFREPAEGLGQDGSPVAHMWRSMIWPNNFL